MTEKSAIRTGLIREVLYGTAGVIATAIAFFSTIEFLTHLFF